MGGEFSRSKAGASRLLSGGASRPPRWMLLFLSALLVPTLILFSAPEKRFTVYSVAANYSLSIVQREGRDYVGLLELLEPLGKVSAKAEGVRWRLRYNNVQGDFQAGREDSTLGSRAGTPISTANSWWRTIAGSSPSPA